MLKELRTFLAVAQHGTFTRAAARIGLTQAAVSAQMKRLEQSLGFELFERQGRVAVLNEAGRATLADAQQLIVLFERLQSSSGGQREAGTIRLELGSVISVQTSYLPDAISALCTEMPHVHLRVVPGVSLNLLGMVDAGTLNAAVIIRPPFDLPAELVWHSLWTEDFELAVPASIKGRDWRALMQQHPFLRYDRASFGGRLVSQFLQTHLISVRDHVEMDELGGLTRLVALGRGVALLPRYPSNHSWPAGVRGVSLGKDCFHREIGVVEHAQNGHRAVVARLVNALRSSSGN